MIHYARKCKLHVAQERGKFTVHRLAAGDNDIIVTGFHMGKRVEPNRFAQAPFGAVAHHGATDFFGYREPDPR